MKMVNVYVRWSRDAEFKLYKTVSEDEVDDIVDGIIDADFVYDGGAIRTWEV